MQHPPAHPPACLHACMHAGITTPAPAGHTPRTPLQLCPPPPRSSTKQHATPALPGYLPTCRSWSVRKGGEGNRGGGLPGFKGFQNAVRWPAVQVSECREVASSTALWPASSSRQPGNLFLKDSSMLGQQLRFPRTTVRYYPSLLYNTTEGCTTPHAFVFEFVCLPWSEVCSARVTSLMLLFLFLLRHYYYYRPLFTCLPF